MKFIKSESTVRPSEYDDKSSPNHIYIRKNITEEIRDNNAYYTYDEACMTPDEYEHYLKQISDENDEFAKLQTRQSETEDALQELILMMYGGD